MAAGVSVSNVSVLDDATPPIRPSSPKKSLTLITAGIFGLFIGISCAFFLERSADTFKNIADVEHYLRLPSLAVVPDFRELNTPTNGPRQYLLSRLASARSETNNPVIVAPQSSNYSAATEAYRALRLTLMLFPSTPPKVILITSGAPNEGKTVTAINTAVAFAQMGSKVVLVDADLRNSQCHKLLKLKNPGGLAEILTHERRLDEVVQPTQFEGLVCIAAGLRPPNPGMLLGSAAMIDLLSVLKSKYDFVLIDSAPVLPVTDALYLASMVDGVVLVVGPAVSRQTTKLVCRRLLHLHAPLLGIVENRVDIRTREGAEHYYYPLDPRSAKVNGLMDDLEV
jgi:capsular exopolysaccharide synthesis family protein